MKSRWVRVSSWVGPAPAVGDQLRSLRARYMITGVEIEEQLQPGRETRRPTRLQLVRITSGTVEGGREHPWAWDKPRGRFRVRNASGN